MQIAFIFVVSHFAAGFSGSLTEGVGGGGMASQGWKINIFVCLFLIIVNKPKFFAGIVLQQCTCCLQSNTPEENKI